jgi:small subunit ribosomal protein S13
MPEEKPKSEPETPPAPAKPEKAEKGEKGERPSKKKEEAKEEPKAPRGPKKLEGVKEDFRYIVRMANTDLDGTRRVSYSLSAIPGVGIRVAEAVADLAGVSKTERLGNLSEEQTEKIEATFGTLGEVFPHWMVNRPKDWETGLDLHAVGADVEIRRRDDINRMKMIRSYKGVRHEQGQRVRGQRTRAHGRTGLTVGVTKKVALAAAQAKKAEETGGRKEEKKEEKKPEAAKKPETKKPEAKA